MLTRGVNGDFMLLVRIIALISVSLPLSTHHGQNDKALQGKMFSRQTKHQMCQLGFIPHLILTVRIRSLA